MSKTTRPHGRASVASPEEGVTPAPARLDRIDALRGAALLWMAAFHGCFDLANWKLLQANFYTDPLWTTQRTLILSTFLLCAGAGQAIATAQGQTWARFGRRWAQIVGCALLVSAGSWFMFPHSYISFGVLHGMAVMLIVARCTAPLGAWLWPLGAVAVALPQVISDPWFDTRLTNWIGLVTHKPITEDFVPVLPWLGVMWWGLAGTQWLLAHRPTWLCSRGAADRQIQGGDLRAQAGGLVQGDARKGASSSDNHALAWRVLVTLGRWSLTFYMVHQPVMLALLAGGLWAISGQLPH